MSLGNHADGRAVRKLEQSIRMSDMNLGLLSAAGYSNLYDSFENIRRQGVPKMAAETNQPLVSGEVTKKCSFKTVCIMRDKAEYKLYIQNIQRTNLCSIQI